MPMRWAAYVGGSTTLAVGVVLKALHQRANFYSACVYLAQSNANLMILTNFIFMVVCAVLLALQKLLYGPLRPIEIEQLYEKAWLAVTETFLAMTIFPRGELGGWFLVMFFSLLAGKVWSWIGEGRVEFLEQQPPANPRLFHTRLAISLSLSILFNSSLFEYSVRSVLQQARPDMMVMFGFEFAILTIGSFSTAFRYGISLAEIFIIHRQKKELIEERRQEIRREREEAQPSSATTTDVPTSPPDEEDIDEMDLDVPGWEDKGRWVFYLDLITDFLKLNVYCAFFAILLTFYGLPIHIIRDVFFTFRSFINRVKDFMRYRTATRDMNERYPDATAEEVAGADVCIICREEMTPWQPESDTNAETNVGTETRRRVRNNVAERMRPKKLPCGHVLHFSCLRSWLERQQNCPTCRRPVLASPTLPGAEGAPGGEGAGANRHAPGQGLGGDQNRENLQNRPRIINLGPLRIGFGAGRGNLINDLARGVNDGDGRQGNRADVVAGPQQYGFGIGWNRNPPQETARTTTSISIQEQIRSLEQQIQQEISGLQLAADQLQVIRTLQTELTRLQSTYGNGSNLLNPLSLPGQRRWVSPLSNLPQTLPPPAQILSAGLQSNALQSGSSDLPEGLVLPEGWSLLPLHRMEYGQPLHPGSQPTQQSASQSPATAAVESQTTATAPQLPLAPTANSTVPGAASTAARPTDIPSFHRNPVGGSNNMPLEHTNVLVNGSTPRDADSVARSSESSPSPPAATSHSDNSNSIPSWGFGDAQMRPRGNTANGSASLTAGQSQQSEPRSSSANSDGEATRKGKGKAATVEDFIEDVD